jgi:biopolymer transport protein ExbB
MKNSVFFAIVMVVAAAISGYIFYGIFGAAEHTSIMHQIYQGGPLVVLLIMLILMNITFIFERLFSLNKAGGRGPVTKYLKNLQTSLANGDVEQAIEHCDRQRGSVANIIRQGLEKYQSLKSSNAPIDEKMKDVQKSVEEATMLEVPLLEKNLIALSTIASIATMVGLLGTTIGMIRAFSAMARAGAPDAISLSVGISEALVNTAGGLVAAIIGIVAYNFFTNKVDSFTYMIDEAGYNVIQSLSNKK